MLTSIVDKIADRVRWRYLTAFILLLTSYILSFYTTQQLLKQANWLNHTNNIINNLDLLHSAVKDGESALRGYVAIKDEKAMPAAPLCPNPCGAFPTASAICGKCSIPRKRHR